MISEISVWLPIAPHYTSVFRQELLVEDRFRAIWMPSTDED